MRSIAPPQNISGALNFRDIGGIPASAGRATRHGLIYRCGELNTLTEADLQTLSALKIRYIFDLRTIPERTAAPSVVLETAVTVPISVGFEAHEDPATSMKSFFSQGVDPGHLTDAMQAATAKIAIDGAPEIGEVLRAIAQEDVPAIIHCTAGKDRTGVLTTVLLSILGVSKENVDQEYLRSNAAVAAQVARLKSATAGAQTGVPSGLAALPRDSVKILLGVDRSFLDTAFSAIDAKYGSFSGYVSDGLKLTPSHLEVLQMRLLEDARYLVAG